MKLLNFAIIKLTLCLVAGIIIGTLFNVSLNLSLELTVGFIFLLFIVLLLSKNQFQKTIWFGILAFITTFFVGILTYNFHKQTNFKTHYTHSVRENNRIKTITFKVTEVLKSGNYYDKYIVDILKINQVSTSGKTLLNLQKDSTQTSLNVDDVLVTTSGLKDLIHPLNPNQFDYKNYLEKQHIYHQIFTEYRFLLYAKSSTKTIFGIAADLRKTINNKLKTYHFKPDELALINALLLGQRQDISADIYNSYTKAGAIHILAVSGLHVGIILLLLNFVFKPIEYLKHGKTIKIILVLLCLWCFAIIAGLSASVTRAVTMFSIVAIGMNLKRPTNIYNTLAISMFLLLLLKPMFLFDVGFQMSYLAVIAIVTIQPMLVKLWTPKWKLQTLFWDVFTVTLAAQFGIIPISLYYFHQFPGLFFVSNLVIIPVLGVILGLGIIIIVLALTHLLPQWLADIYGFIISIMNDFVRWIAQQERFLFKDIAFNMLQVVTAYLVIIGLVAVFKKINFQRLSFLLIAILLFQSVLIFGKYHNKTNEFIIFHKSRYSLIGNKTDAKLTIASNFDSLAQKTDNIIKNYKVGNAITKVDIDTLKSVYQIGTKHLLVIDSFGIYNIKTFKPDYVLLTNTPKINLSRLIDSLKPSMIIADGSNYKSYLKRWESTCIKQKIPFYQTSKKGAFIFKYETY
ncbi:MAG: ComEC/Rec2 family competence protein [Gelidibacter sp.]